MNNVSNMLFAGVSIARVGCFTLVDVGNNGLQAQKIRWKQLCGTLSPGGSEDENGFCDATCGFYWLVHNGIGSLKLDTKFGNELRRENTNKIELVLRHG